MHDAARQTTRQIDLMDPARGNALLAALGRPAGIETGDPLPPFFHQLHFWDAQPPAALGRDGHPRVGGLIPDLGLPRRPLPHRLPGRARGLEAAHACDARPGKRHHPRPAGGLVP